MRHIPIKLPHRIIVTTTITMIDQVGNTNLKKKNLSHGESDRDVMKRDLSYIVVVATSTGSVVVVVAAVDVVVDGCVMGSTSVFGSVGGSFVVDGFVIGFCGTNVDLYSLW